MSPHKNVKNLDGHVRISESERSIMEREGKGFTRVFRIGLDTLKLWRQVDTPSPCVYLYTTRESRSAPSGISSPPPALPARACPCPVCPIRATFPGRAACGQKENLVTVGPLPFLDRIE